MEAPASISLIATLRPDSEVAGLTYEVVAPRSPSYRRPPLLVMLHGDGSNEHDLLGLAPYLDARLLIASARAPFGAGPGGYTWFRTTLTAGGPQIDETQAATSRELLPRFIDGVVAAHDADPRQVYVLGFSQGAGLALALGLTQPQRYAGILAFGARLLPQVSGGVVAPEPLHGTPIFLAHGVLDDVVPIARARGTRSFLANLPVALTYREYSCGHEIPGTALRDAMAWLTQQLDAQQAAVNALQS